MEQYYLVPKELMDKVMSELGSYAYLTNSFSELNPMNESLTNCPLIDLSDEAIEEKAMEYADTKAFLWNTKIEDFKAALTQLKQQK